MQHREFSASELILCRSPPDENLNDKILKHARFNKANIKLEKQKSEASDCGERGTLLILAGIISSQNRYIC